MVENVDRDTFSAKPPACYSLFKLLALAECEEKSTASIHGTDPEPHTREGEREQQCLFLSKTPETIWL